MQTINLVTEGRRGGSATGPPWDGLQALAFSTSFCRPAGMGPGLTAVLAGRGAAHG